MELDCALREELISFFDDETLSQTNQNLQDPIVFYAMTCIRSLSSRKMVGSPREKPTRNSRETGRETRRRRRERDVQLLHKGEAWAWIPRRNLA